VTGLLALAFGAGLLAPVNPCGFGLLPAMLTATLDPSTGEPEQRPVATRLASGLRAGLALTLGFTATFAVIGLGLTAGIRSLITVVPWLAAALGAVLVLVGLALLAGRHLPIKPSSPQPDPTHTRTGTGTGRIVVFGAGYAVASASCTLAVLLAVVAQAAATDLVGAVAVFAAYAAGSALLLITLALLAALAGHTLARALQRVARYAGRIAGALLAVSGAYLLLYWLPQLLGTPRLGDAGLAELAGRVATAITDHQLAVTFTAAVVVLIAATAVIRTPRAITDAPRAGDRCPPEDATATAPPEHSTQ
jgi:cytochrome c-type biogenesis protein